MNALPKINFCLTAEESEAVEEARRRLGRRGVLRNRSEVIRVAIACLQSLDDSQLTEAADKIPRLKPGRVPRDSKPRSNE